MMMMAASEICLVRHEVTSVASASARCMVIYPLGKKSRQRVGVGDKSGTMSVFYMGKTMECVPVFETPPQLKPVSCATLYEDQLFFVRGSILEAYSRKGKLFFTFDTNVTEAIHSIFVFTPFIISCGSFMVTGFQEAKELGFYLAPDRINAMVAFVANPDIDEKRRVFDDYRCVLGCNDRMIRMLRSHKLVEEVRCEAPITALCVSNTSCRVYYGTGAGSLGCLSLRDNGHVFSREFSYIPDGHQAGVTALALYDINMDKREELLVGRRDGLVQVFYIDSEELNGNRCPVCIWSGSADESVLSIAGGLIMHSRLPDVLVHTLSGRIAAFSLKEEVLATPVETVDASHTDSKITDAQIKEVREEIEVLRRTLVNKTQELAKCVGATKDDVPLFAISSTFTAKVSLSQQGNSPALLLAVDADTPMDCVALQSEVRLHFLEMDSADSVMQENIPRNNPLTKTLAVVRPLETRNHSCFVAFWVEDGCWGLLKIIPFTASAPRTAQVKVIQVRPLSLYARVGTLNENTAVGQTPTALSTMEISGNFSARDMHSWLFRMLPGTSDIYQPKMSTLRYEEAFFHYTLEVKYGDGTATITTESLSALAVAKRFIGYCAAGRSLEVSFRSVIHSDGVRCNLRRIVSNIVACNKTSQNIRLLEALQILQVGDDTDAACLPSEFQLLLEREDQVKKEYARTMNTSGYLQRSLVGLYDSVSDFVPNIPKMNPTIKKALEEVGDYTDVSGMMMALEHLFIREGDKAKTAQQVI